MNLSKVVTIRKYDVASLLFIKVTMKISDMIEKPWSLNTSDMGEVLLNELRSERGLDLIPNTEHLYIKEPK